MTAELRALLDVWSGRDHRYSMSRYVLTDDAIDAVRSWRMRESTDLDDPREARLIATEWVPPVRLPR